MRLWRIRRQRLLFRFPSDGIDRLKGRAHACCPEILSSFVSGAAGSGVAGGSAGCALASVEPLSSVKITCPTLILSPCLTLISFTVPVTDDGTSTTALSVSSSITGWPSEIFAPGRNHQANEIALGDVLSQFGKLEFRGAGRCGLFDSPPELGLRPLCRFRGRLWRSALAAASRWRGIRLARLRHSPR